VQISIGLSPANAVTPKGVFSPASIGGLQLWLDASDASTLFQNSNGTTAASADGDPVGYWGDKSGNSNHTIQADGTKKPLLKLGQQNSKSGISFDGVNDSLTKSITTAALGALFGSNNCNIYIAGSQTSVSFWKTLISIGEGRIIFTTNSSGLLAAYCGSDLPTTFNLTSAGRKVIGMRHINSTKYVNFDVAGTAYSLGPMSANGSFTQPILRIGNNNAETQAALGYNFEVLVYNSTISDETHSNIMQYLKTKWSLT
jgi:hypothetical protein